VEFVRRVAALIPAASERRAEAALPRVIARSPPRKHVVRYYGALGPCSPLRSAVNCAAKGKATGAELEAVTNRSPIRISAGFSRDRPMGSAGRRAARHGNKTGPGESEISRPVSS
jgi:hypothetical protein